MPKTHNMIFHPVTLYWHQANQLWFLALLSKCLVPSKSILCMLYHSLRRIVRKVKILVIYWPAGHNIKTHGSIFRWVKILYDTGTVFIPRHTIVAEYYGFTLDVSLSTHSSFCPPVCLYFHFQAITWVNINEFSPNLMCLLILWRSGLGLLMGKFCQFLTKLSAYYMSIFLFPDDNLSKYQWIFTKFGMCIYIVEILLRIANGQISSNFDWLVELKFYGPINPLGSSCASQFT